MTEKKWRCVALVLALLFAVTAWGQQAAGKGSYLVYVGTYTGPASKGIYAYRFNPNSGQSTAARLMAETTNPSFLVIDSTHRFLYAVNEVADYGGEKSGGVSAFRIDRKTGNLTFLNEVATRGTDPCYVTLDKTGKYVLVANYSSGSVAVFPVLEDGRLGQASAFVQHSGRGPDPERQEGPHAHSIELSPDNRFAIATDLGLDELLVYRFDPAKGTLAANDPPFARVEPGHGARHFTFYPNDKLAYVVSEMRSSVTGFSYDPAKGSFQNLQTVSALPPDFKGHDDAAEIEVHPGGRFLYSSNRGHDSVAVFAVNSATGKLRRIENTPTGGKTPRNFAIDPTGSYLFAANQDSNNIVVFRINRRTGHLTPTGTVIQVPSPVCIKFMPME